MSTQRNILIAFLLNIMFSIIEFVGGIFTNSVSIISDSIHDFGDAISIGLSYFFERKSKKKPNEEYTYGYLRYSILGAFITTTVLTIGSVLVIINGIDRIINPVQVNYNGMIIFAVFGLIINFIAAYVTKNGDSINQKSVNLHMLEDVLGWFIVLIGSIVMRFTDIFYIDSFMSLGVALFILFNSFKNFKEILDLFLEKTPQGIFINEIKEHVCGVEGVVDVHHIHIWSIDGINNYATMHVVIDSKDVLKLKNKIKAELQEHGINHVTVETELKGEECNEKECNVNIKGDAYFQHHQYHHHHHHF